MEDNHWVNKWWGKIIRLPVALIYAIAFAIPVACMIFGGTLLGDWVMDQDKKGTK